MTDASTPAQRQRFVSLVENGAGGTMLRGLVQALEHCLVPMPQTASDLLALPPNATYADGAARIRLRWSNGQAAF